MKNNKISGILFLTVAFLSSGNLFCAQEKSQNRPLVVTQRDRIRRQEFVECLFVGNVKGAENKIKSNSLPASFFMGNLLQFEDAQSPVTLLMECIARKHNKSAPPLPKVKKDLDKSIAFLIKHKEAAGIDIQCTDGMTALMFALEAQDTQVALQIIEAGANVTLTTKTKEPLSAYHYALSYGCKEVMDAIVKQVGESSRDGSFRDRINSMNDYVHSLPGIEWPDQSACAILVCLSCKKPEKKEEGRFRKCGTCQNAFYCSRDCQVAHWPEHKQVCKARENVGCSAVD
ncbi:MAG: zinc finger MYND domain-containing protein [Candidatus Dependentiae bacterium]|nr:zinc finger MYND domain-containing protein [Candidatus Dependentiae bacterium]